MGTPSNLRSTIMDPLLNYKFLIGWCETKKTDYKIVAGVSKISALSRSIESADYREGADPFVTRKLPGQVKYDNITLERGVILDPNFEQWANKVWNYQNSGTLGKEVSLADFRKDICIQLCNQAGQMMLKYWVFNAWPTKYQTLPELDASAGATVALETMELVHEGWSRDTTTEAPEYPSFTEPAGAVVAGIAEPK